MNKLETFLNKYGVWIITGLSAILAVCMTVFFYRHNEVLGYNDGLARLNIARSVTDSLTPDIVQLGTGWLPLPQLIMAPFTANDFLWRSGLAGSIMSGASYVVAAVYTFKLAALLTRKQWLGITGALIFMLNPNILYMQTTAMSELALLATLAGTFYHLIKWVDQKRLLDLVLAALWVTLCSLVRYEGWLVVLACIGVVIVEELLVLRNRERAEGYGILFATLGLFGVFLWGLWNMIFWGSLQYFFDGNGVSSSASGIVTSHHVSIMGGLKMVFQGTIPILGIWQFALSGLAVIVLLFTRKRLKLAVYALLLALMPELLILVSIYRRTVQIFATTSYDVRYCITLVLFAAIAIPILIDQLPKMLKLAQPAVGLLVVAACLAIPHSAYYSGIHGGESFTNSEQKFVDHFGQMYKGGWILESNEGDFSPIKHNLGINLRNYIQDGNGKLWQQSLANPRAASIQYVVYANGIMADPVYAAYTRSPEVYDKSYQLVYKQDKYRVLQLRQPQAKSQQGASTYLPR